MRVFGVCVMAITGAMGCGGCAKDRAESVEVKAVTRADAARIEGKKIAVEFSSAIDRYTFFGPKDGPNLLYVTAMERAPAADGSYTFFGGAYTWIAPQDGPSGWIGADGNQSPWPPDPAMDVGATTRMDVTTEWCVVTNPVNRMGLEERKILRMIPDESAAVVVLELVNSGTTSRMSGAWINTAASNEHKIAVRVPPGSEIWAWEGKSAEPLKRIMSAPDADGWALIDLAKANWEGGIKFYIQPGAVNGETKVAIAQWYGGYWMYRCQEDCGAEDFALLRENGEGPVAVYIQPGAEPIIEAELYGRLVNLAPGKSERWREWWYVIKAAMPDVSVLP